MNVNVRFTYEQGAFYGDRNEWAAARGGIGSGKTTPMAWWLIDRITTYPAARAAVVGADYGQLLRGFFPSLLNLLTLPPAAGGLGMRAGVDFDYVKTPSPTLRLRDGGVLESGSAMLIDRMRSSEYQTLYFEEPQTWNNGLGEDAHNVIADRMRQSTVSAALYPDMPLMGRMTFNPPAVGSWLWKMIVERWPARGWHCYHFRLTDNVLMHGLDNYVAGVRARRAPGLWSVEIDGEWATAGGNVYREFNSDVHCNPNVPGLPPIEVDESRLLMWSLDFNYHFMASIIMQMHEQQMVVTGHTNERGQEPQPIEEVAVKGWQPTIAYILDELALTDATVDQVVDTFILRYGEIVKRIAANQPDRIGLVIYGDHTGGSVNQQTVWSNWQRVFQKLEEAGIAFYIKIPSNPLEDDRVNAVRAQMETGAGYGLRIDATRVRELLADFIALARDKKSNKVDKKDLSRSHWADAAGYPIWVERTEANGEQPDFLDFTWR